MVFGAWESLASAVDVAVVVGCVVTCVVGAAVVARVAGGAAVVFGCCWSTWMMLDVCVLDVCVLDVCVLDVCVLSVSVFWLFLETGVLCGGGGAGFALRFCVLIGVVMGVVFLIGVVVLLIGVVAFDG